MILYRITFLKSIVLVFFTVKNNFIFRQNAAAGGEASSVKERRSNCKKITLFLRLN